MKGTTPTAADKRYWNQLCEIVGCIACRKDGNMNRHVSVHHTEGRTKHGAHRKVLPLCAGHHQKGTGNDKTMIAVHPDKARFEAKYGKQSDLIDECNAIIERST